MVSDGSGGDARRDGGDERVGEVRGERSIQPVGGTQSLSRNATSSLRTCARPVLRAGAGPPFRSRRSSGAPCAAATLADRGRVRRPVVDDQHRVASTERGEASVELVGAVAHRDDDGDVGGAARRGRPRVGQPGVGEPTGQRRAAADVRTGPALSSAQAGASGRRQPQHPRRRPAEQRVLVQPARIRIELDS